MWRYEREEKNPARWEPRPQWPMQPTLYVVYILNYSSFNNKRFNACIFQWKSRYDLCLKVLKFYMKLKHSIKVHAAGQWNSFAFSSFLIFLTNYIWKDYMNTWRISLERGEVSLAWLHDGRCFIKDTTHFKK